MKENEDNIDLLARWLSNDVSDQEKEKLDQMKGLDALREVIDDIDTWKLPPLDVDKGLEKIWSQRKEKKKGRNIPINVWMGIAASLTLLIIAVFGWKYYGDAEVHVSTQVAEAKNIELPDGSIVVLDAMSGITYNKRTFGRDRSLHLDGQAFLNVKKGESFIVNSKYGKVSVLGTRFNVKSVQDLFMVACYEGRVKVSSHNEEELLNAGQGVKWSKGEKESLSFDTNEPNWKQGFLDFKNTPIPEVIVELKKYFELQVNLPERYKKLEFTGRIPLSNMENALRTLFITMEIEYEVLSDGTVEFQ